MKKVLIITNLDYASPRIPGLVKFLPEFGWEAIIVTTPVLKKQNLNCKVVEVPFYSFVNYLKELFGFNQDYGVRHHISVRYGVAVNNPFIGFLLKICSEIFYYPDSTRTWKSPALKEIERILKAEKVDLILSSSPPVTSHIISKHISNRHKIPWVSDFRDLWTQNHNYQYGNLRKAIERRLERETIKYANAIITASDMWIWDLKSLHKRDDSVYAITNGFDPALMEIPESKVNKKFTITYTGTVYHGKQDIEKLFIPLQKLINEGIIDQNKIELRFFGSKDILIDKAAEKCGLSGVVNQLGEVSREYSQKMQRESQVLFLLHWNDVSGRGVFPLKFFEYLAAKRPIIAIGIREDNVVKNLLNDIKAGIYASTTDEVRDVVRQYYLEYIHTGEVPYYGEISKINKYNYRSTTERFSEIFRKIS